MGGALGLDPQLVRARTLLNLDSEEDGEVVIGCAGGARATLRVPLAWREPAPGLETRRLVVSGLRGGHSGVQIHEGLGNAIRSLGRILLEARRQAGTMELAGVAGGSAENAIPREASALVRVADASLLERVANEVAATLRAELAGVDEGLSVELRSEPEPDRVVSGPDGERAIDLLAALPHGVLAMSRALRGIVETSINLGVVATDERELTIVLHARSSNEPALDGVLASVEARARLAGASAELGSRYPGWQPQPDSRLLQVTRDAYRAVYGTEPRVTAIHAGLECGALAQRLPGIEMVSFGPEIRAPHSPAERVSVESVGRFWAVLRAVLEALAAPAPG